MNSNPYDNDMGGGNAEGYLRLKVGDTARIRIASEPFFFEETFTVKGEEKTVKRVAWIVLHKTVSDGKPVITPTTYKTGAAVFQYVKDLVKNKEWGDPMGYDITIACNGGDVPNKYYSVAPCPNAKPITSEQKEMIEKANFDLEQMYTKHQKASKQAEAPEYDPFADE